jgi:hypothetical protein
MTTRDYTMLASVIGNTLAAARISGGEDCRSAIYYALYEPLVSELRRDNERFDNLKFAFAVGTAETRYSQIHETI